MLSFDDIYAIAYKKQGDELESLLPKPVSRKKLVSKPDDRYLSDMSLRIFMAGLSWKMVQNKWPHFEEAFFNFNPRRCAFMNAEEIEERMQNPKLIRHLPKIKSVPANAYMVDDLASKHGSFGKFLSDWPEEDITGLWAYLKKHGDRLGGMSGPYFLRMSGKDTFLLTNDVVAALVNHKVVTKKPTGKKDIAEVQERFNLWKQESGRSFSEISRLLSLMV